MPEYLALLLGVSVGWEMLLLLLARFGPKPKRKQKRTPKTKPEK